MVKGVTHLFDYIIKAERANREDRCLLASSSIRFCRKIARSASLATRSGDLSEDQRGSARGMAHARSAVVFNGLRWIIRAGAPWRMMPNDLPPWATVYQQSQHNNSAINGNRGIFSEEGTS
jgi:hypothetical protein